MKSRLIKIFVLMLVVMLFILFHGVIAKEDAGISTTQAVKHTLAVSETGLYIVRLQDASLAAYQGGVAGLKATSPEVTGARRLDTASADSQAYLDYLSGKQGELLRNMAQAFGHPVEAVYQYKNVLNAVAVKLDHSEALRAFDLPGVLTVYPDAVRQLDTDAGPILIGAPSIWDGDTLDGSSTYGEEMIIGVIDTGINHAHPSFADVGKDGYDHTNPYGSGNYVGVCESNPAYADFCNDKLIGAYDFVDSGGPEDEDGHGSHTASTAGGNFVDVVFDDGAGGTFTVEIRGVAPHANLIAYRVCDDGGGCWTSAIVAAVDHAIEDMVDVLNYSISGGDDPWANPVDLAFLDAFTAGIFVSASAGNAGPTPATVAKTGPWNAAVAGTTNSRIIAHLMDVDAAGGPLVGIGAVEGSGPALTADLTGDIIWGGDVDLTNLDGCDTWGGKPFDGVIGLVQCGDCTFAVKVDNLAAAGAIGAVVYNNVSGPPIVMGGLGATTIPAVFITDVDGDAIVTLITGDETATATVHAAQSFVYNDDWANIMASFSSRGPSQWELLKPDYGAPAVKILAAVAVYEGDPVQYGFYQGTSMAAPHGAGSAALLMALHPDWSPAAIKSAIATTAYQDVVDTDGTPADPFDIGSGRIDLNEAAFAGFGLEETSANYVAADPYLGGEPNTLNQPSMVDYTCLSTCSWTRTIQSTMDVAQDWEISFDAPVELGLTASPMSFTLYAGGTQTIEITADMTTASPGVYYFGNVILTPVGNEEVSIGHLPVVGQQGASQEPLYLISGHVEDNFGAPLADVLISDGAGNYTYTDASGNYMLNDLPEGSYTITPSKDAYTFSPTSQSVTVPPDTSGVDFVGTLQVHIYSISGYVEDNVGAPLANVLILDGAGHSTYTDVSGNYLLSDLPSGTYTITPFKTGYTFLPTNQPVRVPPDKSDVDFVGTPLETLYSISGHVEDDVYTPMEDVLISDGAGHSTYTDAGGNYMLNGLPEGSYTITPYKRGYTFSPTSQPVSVPPEKSDVDFVGTPLETLYSISGHVEDDVYTPMEDVLISDGAGHSTYTDASGNYILNDLPEGTYTITPSKDSYTFSPPYQPVTLPPDTSDVDFVGIPPTPKLKLLIVPLDWQNTQQAFEQEAQTQIDIFLDDIPLNACRDRVFVDTLSVTTENFEDFTCSLYNCGLGSIRTFVQDELNIDPAEYDVIVGLTETSTCPPIAGCSNGTDTVWVTSQYDSVTAHELGHIYNLEDEYCSNQAGSTDSRCNDGDIQDDGAITGDVNWLDASLPCDCPPDGSNDSSDSPCCNFGSYECSNVNYGVCCLGNKNSAGGRSTMSYADAPGPRGFDIHDLAHFSSLPQLTCDAEVNSLQNVTAAMSTDNSQKIIDVNLLLHSDGTVTSEDISIQYGLPTSASILEGMLGDYELKIIDLGGNVVWNQEFDVYFDYQGPVVLDVDYSSISFDSVDVSFRIPQACGMNLLELYHNEELIFSEDLPPGCMLALPLIANFP